MAKTKSTHTNGFLLGNQKLMARTAMREERRKKAPDRGSWWIGLSREDFAVKCAEVFPDMSASKEGQRAPMMNFSR